MQISAGFVDDVDCIGAYRNNMARANPVLISIYGRDSTMDRRQFIGKSLIGAGGLAILIHTGCRSNQTAQVVKPGDQQMVGSHTAGAETYMPLVQTAVGNLLSRHSQNIQPVGFNQGPAGTMRICFVGVKNDSIEEMADFKEQLYQQIDTRIVQSQVYQPVSRHFVEAGLRQTHLRPDDLFVPQNMRAFTGVMEQMGQPFDYLLFATLTSGTTRSNKDYQRNYVLTLEMVNIRTGQADKESAELDKQYNVSVAAKLGLKP